MLAACQKIHQLIHEGIHQGQIISVLSGVHGREWERGSRIQKTTTQTNKQQSLYPTSTEKYTILYRIWQSCKKATITWVFCIITGAD